MIYKSLRMRDLLEQFGVATFVGVQSQGPTMRDFNTMGWIPKNDWYTLFAIGFFELGLACIGRNFEQIVVFPKQCGERLLVGH